MKKNLRNILFATIFSFIFLSSPKRLNSYEGNLNHIENYLEEEYILKNVKKSFKELEKIKYCKAIDKYGWNYWQTPQETERLKEGNCVAKSIYEWDLLRQKNIYSEIVWGKMGDTSKVNHFWLEIYLANKTFILECSKNGNLYSRDSIPKNKYKYLKIGKGGKEKIKDYEKRTGVHLDFKYYQ